MRDVKAMLNERGIELDLETMRRARKSAGKVLLGDPRAVEPCVDPKCGR